MGLSLQGHPSRARQPCQPRPFSATEPQDLSRYFSGFPAAVTSALASPYRPAPPTPDAILPAPPRPIIIPPASEAQPSSENQPEPSTASENQPEPPTASENQPEPPPASENQRQPAFDIPEFYMTVINGNSSRTITSGPRTLRSPGRTRRTIRIVNSRVNGGPPITTTISPNDVGGDPPQRPVPDPPYKTKSRISKINCGF